jgi:hypothetical protein
MQAHNVSECRHKENRARRIYLAEQHRQKRDVRAAIREAYTVRADCNGCDAMQARIRAKYNAARERARIGNAPDREPSKPVVNVSRFV